MAPEQTTEISFHSVMRMRYLGQGFAKGRLDVRKESSQSFGQRRIDDALQSEFHHMTCELRLPRRIRIWALQLIITATLGTLLSIFTEGLAMVIVISRCLFFRLCHQSCGRIVGFHTGELDNDLVD